MNPHNTAMSKTSKNKPIPCPVCGRKFIVQSKFAKHVMAHITKELFDFVDGETKARQTPK